MLRREGPVPAAGQAKSRDRSHYPSDARLGAELLAAEQRHAPAEAILALQRSAGNTAAVQLLRGSAGRSVLPPAPFSLGTAGAGPVSVQRANGDEKADPEAEYADCRRRGREIWDKLLGAQESKVASQPDGDEKAAPPPRRDTEALYKANYITETKNESQGVYSAKTNPRLKHKDATPYLYVNTFDVIRKKVTAERNYAFDPEKPEVPWDQTPKAGKLNNSDIIWYQYRAAAHAHSGVERPETIPKLMKVKRVVRHHIENPTTQRVVQKAYPRGRSWTTDHGTDWEPSNEHFHAVLGTPNASPVGYLLADHMFKMEGRPRKISKIQAESEGKALNLVIHLKRGKAKVPKVKKK